MEPPSPRMRPQHAPPDQPETGRFTKPIDIILDDHRWRAVVPQLDVQVRRAVEAVARYTPQDLRPTILLTHDRAVQSLNATYRGRNKPTNVLTFETVEGFGDGDIALAFETVKKEAVSSGRTMKAHMLHLVVHGILHLAGHDHIVAREARQMELAEARILSGLKIPNPWSMGRKSWR